MKFCTKVFESCFGLAEHHKKNKLINNVMKRIELITRRRKVTQKYLTTDICELLKLGYDSNAYRRVGMLYLDEQRSICYDFVTRYCTIVLVSDQLKAKNDQRECPEEYKKAVSSLIYAATRFGDLPELRRLKDLFTKRYGSSFGSFVNKEFIDLLKTDCPTEEMKLGFMQEIAQKHGIEWRGNVSGDHDEKTNITAGKKEWMNMVRETINDDRKKDELIDDVIKHIENANTSREIPKQIENSNSTTHEVFNEHPNVEMIDDMVNNRIANFDTMREIRNEHSSGANKIDDGVLLKQILNEHPNVEKIDDVVKHIEHSDTTLDIPKEHLNVKSKNGKKRVAATRDRRTKPRKKYAPFSGSTLVVNSNTIHKSERLRGPKLQKKAGMSNARATWR